MKHLRTLVVAVLASFAAHVQPALAQGKDVTHQHLLWLRYYNKLNFNDRWSLSTEVEDRRYDFPDRQHQLLIPRVTLTRKLSHGWDVGAGLVYWLQSLPEDGSSPVDLVRPEIRPHQEFNYKQDLGGKFQLSHRYRLEERFIHNSSGNELTPGYKFNFRFRYLFQVAYPLLQHEGSAHTLTLKAYDEIMLNIGSQIVRNVFDQNRAAVGLNYAFSKQFQLQTDFINWFQQRSNGDQFYSRLITRITLYHTLNLNHKS